MRERNFFCHEIVQNNSNWPYVIRTMCMFFMKLLNRCKIFWHVDFNSCWSLTVGLIRRTEISYLEYLLISDKWFKYIVWLEVTMHNMILVNVIDCNGNHCENSDDKPKTLFLLIVNNILQTLIAFCHNYARIILLVFDNIYNFTNQWVF